MVSVGFGFAVILSFGKGFFGLPPDVPAVPAGGVGDESSQSGKLKGIGEDVGDGKVDVRVGVVGFLVEQVVGGEDFGDIVRLAGIVKDS